MSDLVRGNIYANSHEYDSFQARHISTTKRTIHGRTLDGYVATVVRTTTVCDFGKPERDTPDPDAMIEAIEDIPYVPLYPRKVPKTQGRVTEFQARAVAYLTEHGPTSAAKLAPWHGRVSHGAAEAPVQAHGDGLLSRAVPRACGDLGAGRGA